MRSSAKGVDDRRRFEYRRVPVPVRTIHERRRTAAGAGARLGSTSPRRSELRNILALYVRRNLLDFDHAFRIQREAEALLADREYDVDSFGVMALARDSGCSAYDCEFVVVAKELGVKLATVDAKLRKAFPSFTMGLPSA